MKTISLQMLQFQKLPKNPLIDNLNRFGWKTQLLIVLSTRPCGTTYVQAIDNLHNK